MEIVRENQKIIFTPTETATVHEYVTKDGFVSGATAQIRGRYPLKGFVMNTKIKELVYVVTGKGSVTTASGEQSISAGDVVFIDHGEKFAWDGNLDLFIATSPSFDPAQYVEVE